MSGVFGIPYRTTHRDAAYGAALIAGVSGGWWADWRSVPDLEDHVHECDETCRAAAVLSGQGGR